MKRLIIIIGFVLLQVGILSAQTSIAKAQAMYIYNFSRLIAWPAAYQSGNFVIGVLGVSELTNQITTYTANKKVGFQTIEIKEFKNPEDITRCHILFVSYGKSNKMNEVTAKIGSNATLLIGERRGFLASGGAINFNIVGNSLKFNLCAANASKYGLKVSSKLGEMAQENKCD